MFTRTGILILFILLLPSRFLLAAPPENPFRERLIQAQEQVKKFQWNAAEILYLKGAESPLVEDRIQAFEGLDQLYKKLRLFKKAARVEKKLEDEKKFKQSLVPEEESYYETYEVKKGDTYAKLASHNVVSLNWFMRANDHKTLVEGDTIRIPRAHYFLEIDKEKKTLTWKRDTEVLKVYPVAIGREETKTPQGEFVIVNRIKDPIWYRVGQVFPPGSADNLLGTRWLGFNIKGYGIHGTRNPRSIGSAASHGCIRMYNRDVEELFDWIPIGTKVTVR